MRRRLEIELNIAFLELLLGLLVLAGLVLMVMALVDLVSRPSEQWEESGHDQLVWALIVVVVGFVGPLLYLLIARPVLEDAMSATTADASDTAPDSAHSS